MRNLIMGLIIGIGLGGSVAHSAIIRQWRRRIVINLQDPVRADFLSAFFMTTLVIGVFGMINVFIAERIDQIESSLVQWGAVVAQLVLLSGSLYVAERRYRVRKYEIADRYSRY